MLAIQGIVDRQEFQLDDIVPLRGTRWGRFLAIEQRVMPAIKIAASPGIFKRRGGVALSVIRESMIRVDGDVRRNSANVDPNQDWPILRATARDPKPERLDGRWPPPEAGRPG